MLEAMLIGLCGGMFAWGIFSVYDACAGGVGGWQPPPELKWAVNPRWMRWIILAIVAGVCGYIGLLKLYGLI